eukprot:TRINITY_DN6347_c0_g1_i2.p1 TRINITY_DN6347_c0_g1~~TRINITY_DN6347_c0_g1_i2.p1  ORF type:complete len:476 (+),score=70.58 TRINITY_DN6347_c0_g1_i2:149-1576(+)
MNEMNDPKASNTHAFNLKRSDAYMVSPSIRTKSVHEDTKTEIARSTDYPFEKTPMLPHEKSNQSDRNSLNEAGTEMQNAYLFSPHHHPHHHLSLYSFAHGNPNLNMLLGLRQPSESVQPFFFMNQDHHLHQSGNQLGPPAPLQGGGGGHGGMSAQHEVKTPKPIHCYDLDAALNAHNQSSEGKNPSQNDSFAGEQDNVAEITLTGYLIKLIRQNGGYNTEDSLAEGVKKIIDFLRRPDGSKYSGDVMRTVRGCLFSNNLFFRVSHSEDEWGIKEDLAKQFEEQTARKIMRKIENKEKRKISKKEKLLVDNERIAKINTDDQDIDILGRDVDFGGPGEMMKTDLGKRRRYKKKKEKYELAVKLMDKCCAYIKQNKLGTNLLKNPFRFFNGNESFEEIWQKLGGGEKAIGILQCFEFFQPLIGEALYKTNEKNAPGAPGGKDLKSIQKGLDNISKRMVSIESKIQASTVNSTLPENL